MNHNPEYFQDEVREGFYIPGMIKRSWAVQMDVLDKVRQICDKHNLKWFADYGTLIGAARHKGFIPWDDDLDICMLRDELDEFIKYAREELPAEYVLLDVFENAEYNNFLVRVTNNSAINYSSEYLDRNCGFPYAVGIDIFALDYLYNDETEEEKHRERTKALMDYADAVKGSNGDPQQIIKEAENLIGFELDRTVSADAAILRGLITSFKEAPKEGAKYVANYYFWVKNHSQKYPVEHFGKVAKLPFEDIEINVNPAYAYKLRDNYGKWEAANREGGIHGYPYFASQEQALKQALGELPYLYDYRKEDLHTTRGINEKRPDAIIEMYNILHRANGLIADAAKDLPAVANLLEQCQNIAVNIGNRIEKRFGEGTTAVSFLEEYCETLFVLLESIEAGENDKAADTLETAQTLTDNSLTEYRILARRKLAMFVPFSAEHWNAMEWYYRELIKDEEWDVIVVPTPYFDKDFRGNMICEHFDLNSYPGDLSVIDYREFDFADFYADMIVIQNPYDAKNGAISVLPFFYAENLYKFTDNLTYIPYFKTGDISDKDFKSKTNMKYYVMTPGVMFADYVILDSERKCKNYIEFLTEQTGEYTEDIWREKIIFAKADEKEKQKRCDRKKTLIFYVDFSEVFVWREKMLDKIARVLEVFKENSNSLWVIWKNDPAMANNLKNVCPDIAGDFDLLVKRFEDMQIGVYDTEPYSEELPNKCDAFYGDGGYLMNLCVSKGIPVMKMNIEV